MNSSVVYRQKLADHIELELIYEESPVFVGDEENELSAVVGIKYTGPLPALETVPVPEPGPVTVDGEAKKGNGWLGGIGKRLSVQLTNTTRNLLLQELDTLDEDLENKYLDQTLLLGYTQVFGYFTYNDQIFNSKKFDELRKKSVIGGKLAGIEGLEVVDDQNAGFLGSVATGLGGMFNAGLTPADMEESTGTDFKLHDMVPIFTTKQSILFPEIVFKPLERQNLSKNFYINVKLPKFLPPSYSSLASIKIQYNLILGYQILDDSGRWHNKLVFFPLEIRPFVNQFGQQPIYNLLSPQLGYPVKQKTMDLEEENLKNFKAIKRKMMISTRRSSTMTVSTFENNLGSNETVLDIKGDRDKFLDFINEMNNKDVNDLIGIQEKFESEFVSTREKSNNVENVKENLINIFNNPNNIVLKIKKFNENPEPESTNGDEPESYHSQIPMKQQLNFILKRNGELITTISLSKAIISFNDILKIHLSFQNSQVPITGILLQLIKVEKFANDEFLKDEDELILDVEISGNGEFETRLNESLVSCFNTKNEEISMDMLIPNDAIRTGQFKSNLIETRYCILFKFILLDKTPTDQGEPNVQDTNEYIEIYKDSKGSLFRGVDFLSNGMEFYCKIPIILLSSYEQDFGTSVLL